MRRFWKLFVEDGKHVLYEVSGKGQKTGEPLGAHETNEAACAAAKNMDGYVEWKPYGGATSIAAALAYEEAQETAWEVENTLWMFVDVVRNIAADPEVTQKGRAIAEAAAALPGLIDGALEGEPDKSAPALAPPPQPAKAEADLLTVKSIGEGRLGGYAVLWGDADRKDLTGEWFDRDTAELTVIFDALGRMPLLYHHSMDATVKTAVVGIVDTLRADEVGLWYEAQERLADEYGEAIQKLLAKGKLKTSSQTFAVARRVAKNGRIERWPIVELSLTPTPAEYRMPAVEKIKAAYAEIGCDDTLTQGAFEQAGYRTTGKETQRGAEEARLRLELERERALLDDLAA